MDNEKMPEREMHFRSPFLKKLDNFFYHYKWHSIAAFFLIVVIIVCSLQFCVKEPYDIEIMYAGPANLNGKQTVLDIQGAFAAFAPDKNEDGEHHARLVAYWVDEKYFDKNQTEGANVAQLANNAYNNQQAYRDEIAAGNLSICLVSPHLFYMVHKEGGFMNISELLPELSEDVYHVCESGAVNHYAVTLSKTPLGQLAGLSTLPSDTILCIRKPTYHLLNASRLEEQHATSLETLLNALRFQAN